jgi:hypothetical protein
MKYAILFSTILLTGCSIFQKPIPVKMSFPDAPEEMKIACPDLKSVPENETKLSVIVDTVVQNYGQYEQCRNKVDAWIEWHKLQKQINESVK